MLNWPMLKVSRISATAASLGTNIVYGSSPLDKECSLKYVLDCHIETLSITLILQINLQEQRHQN